MRPAELRRNPEGSNAFRWGGGRPGEIREPRRLPVQLFDRGESLRWKLLEGRLKLPDVAEYQERLLEDLSRVERTEIRLGAQSRTWYLNVTDHVKDALRRLKCPQLLEEKPREPTPAVG